MSTVEDVAPLCLAPGCPYPQTSRSRLCTVDTVRLGDWIAQLGDEYAHLDATPSMQAAAAGTVGGGGLASHQSVGDVDVMVLRDRRSRERGSGDADGNRGRGVLEVLAARAQQVREDLRLRVPVRQLVIRLRDERAPGPLCAAYAALSGPCGHPSCRAAVVLHTVPADPTVATERALLSRHLDWVLAQDWAGEFFTEMRDLWSLLRAANGHGAPPQRLRCPECSSPARWVEGAVVCGGCGTTTSGLAIVRRHGAGAAA